MINNFRQPLDGSIEENKLGVYVKFNLGVARPKIDVLKTNASCNICSDTIKNLIDLKRKISNI
jgi:hypothetical protein